MMRELVKWYNYQVNENALHPLLLIGIFINVFLAIHPFRDANGRLSRIITTLLLLRSGYSYVPYSSMETVIENNKEAYYMALRRTQQTIHTENQNWEPWLIFFLRTMLKQIENLSDKLLKERFLRDTLPSLSRKILEMVQTRSEVTVREIESITKANRNTIKAYLTRLTNQEYLIKAGKGRGVRYFPKK
ncbi:MAG TPA: Fic family protein [Oligoflexia bacterium]|nr:Fic family protein [Oligoflexia bacterium]HMP49103.1 Fic family protein [Oligoflexia bacterium]